jgi:hypothetical protein
MNNQPCFTRGPLRLLVASAVCLSIAVSHYAQVKPASTEAAQADNKDPLELSVYKVTSTQEAGYVAKSATPFKTRQQIVDIPQSSRWSRVT